MGMTQDNKKVTIPILSALAILIVVALTFNYFKHHTNHSGYRKELMEIASQANRACPVMIDDDTRLDSVSAQPDQTLQYHYTMVRVWKDSINIPNLQTNLESNLLNAVQTNPILRPYREHRVTLIYNYKDKEGSFITKITISPDKYNKD